MVPVVDANGWRNWRQSLSYTMAPVIDANGWRQWHQQLTYSVFAPMATIIEASQWHQLLALMVGANH